MQSLRIGTHLASNSVTRSFQAAVADEIGRRVGCGVEFVVETSYDSYQAGSNDVSFICSLAYLALERDGRTHATPVAAPILEGPRYGGRPLSFSDVIVRRDSSIRSFADLRGRSWAYNEPLSQSGYGITRYHLARLGEVDGFFGRLVQAGFHANAIRMVADGRVHGSAIDSQVLAIELREHPNLADHIAVVDVLGPSTAQPVVVAEDVSPDLRHLIADALVTMHEDRPTTFESAMVERFARVGHAAYEDVRAMASFCESVGLSDLR